MKGVYITILILAIIAVVVHFWMKDDTAQDYEGDEMVYCTLDAKVCPDGSSVDRVAPNCDFAACPASSSTDSLLNATIRAS